VSGVDRHLGPPESEQEVVADAPMTWGDYISYKARAEAAERRVAELEKALRSAADRFEEIFESEDPEFISEHAYFGIRNAERAVSGEPPE